MMQKTRYRGIYLHEKRDGTITYYIRVSVNGKQTSQKVNGDINEAVRQRNEWEENQLSKKIDEKFGRLIECPACHSIIDVRNKTIYAERGRLLFDELVKIYLKDYKARKPDKYPANIARINSVTKRLLSLYSGQYVSQIKARDIARAYLPRNELIFLRAMLNFAVKWEYLDRLPSIDIPASKQTVGRRLSPEEIRAALEQASPDHHDAILLCLYLGGCRLGELTKITIDNADFEQGTITLDDRKAGVPKIFVMVNSAAQIIRRRFLANGGRAFTQAPSRLSAIFWQERCEMHGIKPWRFHDLRHTAPSWLEDQGVPGHILSALLGHRSERMRKRYVHSTLTREREALTVLEQIVGEAIDV